MILERQLSAMNLSSSRCRVNLCCGSAAPGSRVSLIYDIESGYPLVQEIKRQGKRDATVLAANERLS